MGVGGWGLGADLPPQPPSPHSHPPGNGVPITVTPQIPRGPAVAGSTGKVVRIIGPVVDVEFPAEQLPDIYNAVEIPMADGKKLVVETQQHLGDNRVRCVAMGSTDGLRRGTDALDLGGPITVPVGQATLGRIFNVR